MDGVEREGEGCGEQSEKRAESAIATSTFPFSVYRPLLPRLPLSASLLRPRGANFALILFAPSRDDDRPTARDMAHEGISRMTNAIRLYRAEQMLAF